MSRIYGTYRDGRIVPDTSVDWPEGARVAIEAAGPASDPADTDEPDGPVARADRVAWLDAMEPLELTPEDESEIASARDVARQASLRAVRRRMGLAP